MRPHHTVPAHTRSLCHLLHVFQQDEQPKPRLPTADGAAAAAAAPAPFEQLFCGAFAVLDRQWLARKATYMDFPAVMK